MCRRKLLLINPNTSVATTERLSHVLASTLPNDVDLELRTAQFGASYIACEASHAVTVHAVLDVCALLWPAPGAG